MKSKKLKPPPKYSRWGQLWPPKNPDSDFTPPDFTFPDFAPDICETSLNWDSSPNQHHSSLQANGAWTVWSHHHHQSTSLAWTFNATTVCTGGFRWRSTRFVLKVIISVPPFETEVACRCTVHHPHLLQHETVWRFGKSTKMDLSFEN